MWDIVKYAIRNKECRNAVLIDFICNKQARANCERAKDKGVFKFRKLKKLFGVFGNFFGKSINYKSGGVPNLAVVEPLQLV